MHAGTDLRFRPSLNTSALPETIDERRQMDLTALS